MVKAKKGFNLFWTVLLSVASVLYVYPILMILLNSFKKETSISTSTAFLPPTADTFAGAANYINAISSKGFLQSFWYSTLITVTSVALILLCCSMCAWYITRVNSLMSKAMYYLCVFSMVVPFQMVMLHSVPARRTRLGLRKPSWTICHHRPRLRRRARRVHVLRLYEERPDRDRRGRHDRRLQPHPDLLQGRVPAAQAHDGLRRHPRGHVDMERLPAAHAGAGHRQVQDHTPC